MPHIVGTHFGYVVMGSAPCVFLSTIDMPSTANLNVALLSSSDADLHSSLQRFWHQEEPPISLEKTAEEEFCDNHFHTTHSRDSEGPTSV